MRPLQILTVQALLLSGAGLAADSYGNKHIQFGEPASESAYQLTTKGKVQVEILATEIGGLKRNYPARTLLEEGAALSVTFERPATAKSLVLEVQEIHNRRPRAFGYKVSVNGVDLYFRTYEELGDGPNHYFISIPATVPGEMLKVTFENAGAWPFSLGQLWLHADFFETTAQSEKVYRPLGLLGKFAKPSDKEFKSFAPLGDVLLTNYGNKPYAQTGDDVRKKLETSAQTGRPVQIMLNGASWGGAPSGPDGLGGYFNDGRYSMLAYDRVADRFVPSWPNMWASTFWATVRDPHMNAIMKHRFLQSLAEVPDLLAFQKVRGTPAQPIFVQELGPPMGEVTGSTIAAAARDGIRLDPRDGFDEQERLWLYRDSVHLWQEYARWAAEAFPRDAVVVDQGRLQLPADQTSENIYSHTIFGADGPMKDRRWFGGQVGMVDGLWSSGEVFWDKFALYDYIRANGKLSFVNLEATILKGDYSPLWNHYSCGFQFVTFLNDSEEAIKFIEAVDGRDGQPALARVHYEPCLLDCKYGLLAAMGPQIVSSNNLNVHQQAIETADVISTARLQVTDCAVPGQVTYRITNGGSPLNSGLTLDLDGRISPGSGNRIEVQVGDSQESLRTVSVLSDAHLPCPDHWTHFMTSKTSVDLGTQMAGKTECYLRLIIHAQPEPDAAFLLSARVTAQWPMQSGQLTGNPFTMREKRTLELWVQDRAVARRLLERYRGLGGTDEIGRQAARLFADGRYRSVQHLLNGELSQLLPARYVVRGHGKLGRYPIEIRLPSADQVVLITLMEAGPEAYEFKLASESGAQPCQLTIIPEKQQSAWGLTRIGPNHYRLAAGAGEKTVITEGKIVVSLEAVQAASVEPKLPKSFTARFLDGDKRAIRLDLQDLELMNYAESIELPLAEPVRVSRKAERLTKAGDAQWPQKFDLVKLELNARGEVISMDAVYGHDRGRIKAVYPPVLVGDVSVGGIELESGARYDFAHGTQFDTVAMHGPFCAYETAMLTMALKPGHEVEIDYSPYAEKGGRKRLIHVAQKYTVLLDEDYTTSRGDQWKNKTLAREGVTVGPHKPEPNYLHDVSMQLMRPTRHFEPGSVVYEIESPRPLKTTVVEFTARAFEDSSRVEFFISQDGKSWIKCGQFDNSWQNPYPQSINSKSWKNPPQFIDLTSAVEGCRSFQLKLVLRVNSADERFCVGGVRVITEETSNNNRSEI
jgi:hypothetical protein